MVGFSIDGLDCFVLFLFDIDSWEEWDEEGICIEDMIVLVDVVYLDVMFFVNGEIFGCDMSGFLYLFIIYLMVWFVDLLVMEKVKVCFIYFNYINLVCFFDSFEC